MLRAANCLADCEEQGAQRDAFVTPSSWKAEATSNRILKLHFLVRMPVSCVFK